MLAFFQLNFVYLSEHLNFLAMTDSNYIKVFTGSLITVQRIISELERVGIKAVVKDETESARLAGFGGGIVPGFQEVFVHKDQLDKAVLVIEEINSELQA